MKESFLGEVTKFITKWGIELVPIYICVVVNDVKKNTTDHQTTWLKLEMKLHMKPINILCLTNYFFTVVIFIFPSYCLHTYIRSYCIQHVMFLLISVILVI